MLSQQRSLLVPVSESSSQVQPARSTLTRYRTVLTSDGRPERQRWSVDRLTLIPDPWSRGCVDLTASAVAGDCLKDAGIHDKHSVVIGVGIEPRNGDIAAVRLSKAAATRCGWSSSPMLKRFYRRGAMVMLWTANGDQQSLLIPARSLTVLGVVIASYSDSWAALSERSRWERGMPKAARAARETLQKAAVDAWQARHGCLRVPDDTMADEGFGAGDLAYYERGVRPKRGTAAVVRLTEAARLRCGFPSQTVVRRCVYLGDAILLKAAGIGGHDRIVMTADVVSVSRVTSVSRRLRYE